jgi:hypothetical protein
MVNSLVAGAVAALVHAPIESPRGCAVPLGLISFDEAVLAFRRFHAVRSASLIATSVAKWPERSLAS